METILFPSDNDFWNIFCWKKVYIWKNVAFFSTNRKMFNVFGKTLIYLPLIKKKKKKNRNLSNIEKYSDSNDLIR